MIWALLLVAAVDGGLPHVVIKFKPHRTGIVRELQKDRIVLELADKSRLGIATTGVTIVHRDGRDVELDELRVGDRADVHVMPRQGGDLEAVDIAARSPPKRKKPAGAPKGGADGGSTRR
jgi:hypothetical protein